MPTKYKNTKIYYIPVGDKKYYGHTIRTLDRRKRGHKRDFNKQPKRKVYKAMREVGMTIDDIELILVEDFPCENVYQARARERYWIERDGSLNVCVPNRTFEEYRQKQRERYANEEYRQKRRERLIEKNAMYEAMNQRIKEYEQKRDYWLERINCEYCSKEMKRSNLKEHHKRYCKKIRLS